MGPDLTQNTWGRRYPYIPGGSNYSGPFTVYLLTNDRGWYGITLSDFCAEVIIIWIYSASLVSVCDISKLSTSDNPNYKAILEPFHAVLGNLVKTFNIKDTCKVKYDPWLVILVAEVFSIHSIANTLKVYSLCQLGFWQWCDYPNKTYCGLVVNKSDKADKNNKDNIRKILK